MLTDIVPTAPTQKASTDLHWIYSTLIATSVPKPHQSISRYLTFLLVSAQASVSTTSPTRLFFGIPQPPRTRDGPPLRYGIDMPSGRSRSCHPTQGAPRQRPWTVLKNSCCNLFLRNGSETTNVQKNKESSRTRLTNSGMRACACWETLRMAMPRRQKTC